MAASTESANGTSSSRTTVKLTLARKALYSGLAFLLVLAGVELMLLAIGVKNVLEVEDPSRGFSGLAPVFEKDESGKFYTSDPKQVPRNLGTFNAQSFLVEKPTSGLRVFCLGGSSAHGFPRGADAAFHSVLGELLATSLPDRHVEAINAAGVSYASHRVRIVANEILRYQPDLLVIYSGHNEFIEKRYFYSRQQSVRRQTPLNLILYRWRLYSVMYQHLPRLKSATAQGHLNSSPMLQTQVRRDPDGFIPADERQALQQFYKNNLRAIVRQSKDRGTTVVLCTVPANLRDWKPVRWVDPPALAAADLDEWQRLMNRVRGLINDLEQLLDRDDAARKIRRTSARNALELLQRAANLLPEDAETSFLKGRAYESLQRWQDANASYRRAYELDDGVTRATDGINRAVREVAASEDVILVDVEQEFVDQSPHGLIGYNLIEDYVHPTVEAHQQIALAIWRVLREQGVINTSSNVEAEGLFAKVTNLRQGRVFAEENTARFFYNQGIIFSNQRDYQKAIEKFEQSLQLAPRFASAHYNLGIVLQQVDEMNRAERHFQLAVRYDSEFAEGYLRLAELLIRRNKPGDAIPLLRKALDLQPQLCTVQNAMGVALASIGKMRQAIPYFRESLRLDPAYADAHQNLARSFMLLGKLGEAEKHFRSAIDLHLEDPLLLTFLAQVLVEQGKLSDAEVFLERALEIDNDFEPARALKTRIRTL